MKDKESLEAGVIAALIGIVLMLIGIVAAVLYTGLHIFARTYEWLAMVTKATWIVGIILVVIGATWSAVTQFLKDDESQKRRRR